MKEFKVSEFITLRLIDDRTVIYDPYRMQCQIDGKVIKKDG